MVISGSPSPVRPPGDPDPATRVAGQRSPALACRCPANRTWRRGIGWWWFSGSCTAAAWVSNQAYVSGDVAPGDPVRRPAPPLLVPSVLCPKRIGHRLGEHIVLMISQFPL